MREQLKEILERVVIDCEFNKPRDRTATIESDVREILSLFKEQIEKMEVLSDEEIGKAFANAVDPTDLPFNVEKRIEEDAKRRRAIAQAQLAKCKKDLRGCE